MTAFLNFMRGLRTFGVDVVQGFFAISHNGFALVGLCVMVGAVTLVARPDLRASGEQELRTWLQSRQPEASTEVSAIASEPDAIDRATAADPKDLPKQQAAVTYWLSRKYNVAPEPLSVLVAQAYETSASTQIDATLILAVMAVESGFNPFAQSKVGAQGLMQVMTKIHSDKYQNFGGQFAAFDPVSNLKVGAKVLQECIRRSGSVEAGLKAYVGAANMEDDGGYAAKVLAEHARLRQVAAGHNVPISSPPTPTLVAPSTPAAPTPEPVPAPITTPVDNTVASIAHS